MQIQGLTIILGLLAGPSISEAVRGFSYGSTNGGGSCRRYDDFKELFERARSLPGTSDFTAARLYTSIQCGTSADPIEAYQAAIDTDTKIMVGLWASAGHYVYDNELNALISAAKRLGTAFTDRVVGISVGSEDLYRNSPQGIINGAGAGASAKEIEGYISRMRNWVNGTQLESKPVTHVDTWTAWVLPETGGVIQAVDFLSHNSFPYFEDVRPNAIEKAAYNFWSAVNATESVAQGKDVWITETGWPDTGPVRRDAVPSLDNAKTYWNTIGCPLFGKRSTFWYTLVDGARNSSDLSFAITPDSEATPKFDLACP
ncbi:GPI-anchored cell wall beta-1,3-endoglucanase EglC [Xylaria arbuscula]|nr:GPI-anchored cell wall beta-1,3-endoglucanase EglC [Xylaria arbuscula]